MCILLEAYHCAEETVEFITLQLSTSLDDTIVICVYYSKCANRKQYDM